MKKSMFTLFALTYMLMGFTLDVKEIVFNYPKNKEARFAMRTDKFKKFKKEW